MRRPAVSDTIRRDIEDDILFRASDASMSSRQYWSVKSDGDRRHHYKRFSGWSEQDVRKFLIQAVDKLVFEAGFLLFRIGIPEKHLHDVVEKAYEKHVMTK